MPVANDVPLFCFQNPQLQGGGMRQHQLPAADDGPLRELHLSAARPGAGPGRLLPRADHGRHQTLHGGARIQKIRPNRGEL